MDLLNHYLAAVKSYLPEAQREDIIRELSENIRSQMDDKSQDLGRPLTDAERESIIRQHGHPIFVAGRYLPRQYFIGPALFPLYWFVVKTTSWMALVLLSLAASMTPFVAGIIASIGHRAVPAAVESPARIFEVGALLVMALLALVTSAFGVIEHFQLKSYLQKEWSIRHLRPIHQPTLGLTGKRRTRGQSLAVLVVSVGVVLAWFAVPDFPLVFFWGWGPPVLEPAPGWAAFRLWFLLYPLLAIAEMSMNLLRPMMNWHRPVLVAARLAGLFALLLLARTTDFVQPITGAVGPSGEDLTWIASVVNSAFFYCALLGLCLGMLEQAKGFIQYMTHRVHATPVPTAPRPS